MTERVREKIMEKESANGSETAEKSGDGEK